MHQRSPSIFSQPKSPPRVQNSCLTRSPKHLPPEGSAPNSVTVPDAPYILKNNSASPPNIRPLRTLKTSSVDASITKNVPLSSDKANEAFPRKYESTLSNSSNPLKVRIKLGPDMLAQYNAEVCSLGLTSPSSSEGNSPEESGGILLESHEPPKESPANILRIMTSNPFPGGLSPLCEDLLNLARETEFCAKHENEVGAKSSVISADLLDNVVSGNRTKFYRSENIEKSENEHIVDLNECRKKNLGNDTLDYSLLPLHDLNCKPSSDTSRETEEGAPLKKRSKDALVHVSDHSCGKHEQPESRYSSLEKIGEHRPDISQKDVSVDHGHDSRSRGDRNCASSKAYYDISEGERVNESMDNSNTKVRPQAISSKHCGPGTPNTVKGLLFEGKKKLKGSQISGKIDPELANGSCAAPKIKCSGKKDDHVENPKYLLGISSGDMPKKFPVKGANAKHAHAHKLKERSSNKKFFGKVTSGTAEPPADAIDPKEGILEQTVAAPIVIQEDWVGCDRCQKWRLLPYGTKSEQLPDKWVCSMLDWLPGMNHCDISEDETSDAVRASYLVPVPESQHNLQACGDGTPGGVISAGMHYFSQNQQSSSDHLADQVKKKLKEKPNTLSMRGPVLSSGKKVRQLVVKNGSSKEVNQSFAEVNAADKSDMQHPSNSAVVVKKRKGEHVIRDEANSSKQMKKESAQQVHGKVKIKSTGALTMNNFQNSGGSQGMIGHTHSLMSGLPDEAAVRVRKKKNTQQDAISLDDSHISVKKRRDQMQDLPEKNLKTFSSKELSTEKIKLKERDNSQHQVQIMQNSGRNLHYRKDSIKEEPPTRMPYLNQFSPVMGTAGKVDSLHSDVPAVGPVKKFRGTSESSELGIVKRGDTTDIPCSDSSGNLGLDFWESDARDRSRGELVSGVKLPSHFVNSKVVGNKGNVLEQGSSAPTCSTLIENHSTTDEEWSKDNSDTMLAKQKNKKNASLRSLGKHITVNNVKSNDSCSPKKVSTQMEPWSGKLRIDLRQGGKQVALCPSKHATGPLASVNKSLMDSEPIDASVVGDTTNARKEPTIACLQKRTTNFITEAERPVDLDTSPANKNATSFTASAALKEAEDVLKEAEELRSHADLIKNSGFGSESNYGYFRAALKFLQGASHLETCNGENRKHFEMNPLQMYSAAAKLCKNCAYEYEKGHEMAAAALAYKCEEVACLKIVYCKSSSTFRDCHDLQSSLQKFPLGESPSSSVSDVDNLNNLAKADKAILSKGNGSHVGSYVIMPHDWPKFARVLDFTKDVNSAMEAAKKSQDTFAAARAELEESQNKEGIISIKRVIDLSFENVEDLVRLVWAAFNTISRQDLRGS